MFFFFFSSSSEDDEELESEEGQGDVDDEDEEGAQAVFPETVRRGVGVGGQEESCINRQSSKT